MDIDKYYECLELLKDISVDFDSLGEEDEDKFAVCKEIKEIAADTFRRL